jgi:hypothetical protein
MFAPAHDNPPSLRQGDVVANVFFPLPKPSSLRYLATYESGSGVNIKLEPLIDKPPGSRKEYTQSIAHGVVAHGAIISQCCDLDNNHPKPSFSLCRLIPFERDRYKNADALINNIDPWGNEKPHLQFFYYGRIDGLEGEYLADFGLLTSLGWSDYKLILGCKVNQLDNLNRNKFRVKVGAFFGRPTAEDVQAGLANPYDPVPAVRSNLIQRIYSWFRSFWR